MPLFNNVHVTDEAYATIGKALDALTRKGVTGNEALEVLLLRGANATLATPASRSAKAKGKARK